MFYVYCLKDPRTGLPFYVGKGSGDRVRFHVRQIMYSAENVKGLKDQIILDLIGLGMLPIEEIIQSGMTEAAAYELEIELIKRYGRSQIDGGLLANISPGGNGYARLIGRYQGANNPFYGKRHTEATKQKISAARRMWYKTYEHPFLGKNHTEESKRIMSEKRKRWLSTNPHPFKGKTHSEETRRKISEANRGNQNRLGKKHTEETKQKLSEAGKKIAADRAQMSDEEKAARSKKISDGIKNSPKNAERRQKISERMKGRPGKTLGMKHSEETKQKMRDAAKKRKLLKEQKLNESHD